MSQSYRLKRFTNAPILRRIDFSLLVEFFESDDRFVQFLSQRGMRWTRERGTFDYDALASILMDPGVDAPDELLDALYFVDNLADDECYDSILRECSSAGIDLGTAELTPEELTLRVWLRDRNILERVHAEHRRVSPRKFESFYPTFGRPPEFRPPSAQALSVLEDDLNTWYAFKKKGRGARIFVFPREDGVWFLIRHGQRLKREGTMESDGAPGSVFYRPEKFDVAIYYPATGELAINTATKGEREAYCNHFGKHFFGNERFFRFVEPLAKYTLRPLIEQGLGALACSDVEGMRSVRLSELCIAHRGDQYDIEIRRASDVFAALARQGRAVEQTEDSRELLRAKFSIIFSDGAERKVVIEPPNIASFDRDADNAIVHEWLSRRGFICTQTRRDGSDARPDAVVAVH